MGWKREVDRLGESENVGLSENQCGMETEEVRLPFLQHQFVEREPMWDGNSGVRTMRGVPAKVEREPMWDGNSMV